MLAYGSVAKDGWSRYTLELIEALARSGTDAHLLPVRLGSPYRYQTAPWLPLVDAFAVRRALRTDESSILHITVEPYLLLLPFLPLSSRTVVLTVHGSYAYLPVLAPRVLRPFYRAWYRHALARVDRIIAVSAYTKSYLLRSFADAGIAYDERRISVIHNGIDVSRFPYPVSRERGGAKTVLTVAPVRARKGIREALRAIAAYRARYGALSYRLVGSYEGSPEMERVREDVRSLGLEDTVFFVGPVSEEELLEEYRRADAFLMLPVVKGPYFEGFGLVYLEANAAGLPVVASAEGGSAEAVAEGKSGYLVAPQDAATAAERLHAVLDEKRIAPEAARAWAEAHSAAETAQRVRELYRDLVAQPGAGSGGMV